MPLKISAWCNVRESEHLRVRKQHSGLCDANQEKSRQLAKIGGVGGLSLKTRLANAVGIVEHERRDQIAGLQHRAFGLDRLDHTLEPEVGEVGGGGEFAQHGKVGKFSKRR